MLNLDDLFARLECFGCNVRTPLFLLLWTTETITFMLNFALMILSVPCDKLLPSFYTRLAIYFILKRIIAIHYNV